jgi:anaerobic selenocysteine-containing dehydrogenase
MPLRKSHWASLSPFGLSETGPRHFRKMARVAWENRDQLPFAWRILTQGVCDGCALGTDGLSDWTIDGTHLCMVRLELLRLNTMPALDPGRLADAGRLQALSSKELRELGRLPEPLLRRRGEKGFRVIGWEEALDLAAARLASADPDRVAFYLTSRGIPNGTCWAARLRPWSPCRCRRRGKPRPYGIGVRTGAEGRKTGRRPASRSFARSPSPGVTEAAEASVGGTVPSPG